MVFVYQMMISQEQPLLTKYVHWYFPLQASYPQFLNDYLDKFVGRNGSLNNTQREEFIQRVYQSLSLDIADKKRTLREYKNLSKWQIDELTKVFVEEEQKFLQLRKEHPEDIRKLVTKQGIDWIFILIDIDVSISALELAHQGDKELVAKYCLSELEKRSLCKEYIIIFESIETSRFLTASHWNTYLNCLSIENKTNKLKSVKIPKDISTDFLEACRASYLLKQLQLERFPSKLLKNTFSFLRDKKDKHVKNQFIHDLNFYYLYKGKNVNKFFFREIKLFLESNLISELDEEVKFSWFSKAFSYIFPVYIHLEDEDLSFFLDFLYLSLTRMLDIKECKLNEFNLAQFYEANGEDIIGLASHLLLIPENQHRFFTIINRHYKLKEKSDVFTNILLQSTYMIDLQYLKNNIDFYIKNSKPSVKAIFCLYMILMVKRNKGAAEYLLEKFQESYNSAQLSVTLDTLIKGSVEFSVYFSAFQNVRKNIEESVEKHHLNLNFEEYQRLKAVSTEEQIKNE